VQLGNEGPSGTRGKLAHVRQAKLLARRVVEDGELAAGDLSGRFQLPKPTMSHHLGVLLESRGLGFADALEELTHRMGR